MGLKKLGIVMGILAMLAFGVGTAFAALVPNGDFELGNTGFTSAYLYFAQPITPATDYTSPKSSLYDEGTYGVGTDPALYHGSWASFGDHTSGTGMMMIVNGDTTPNINLWASPAVSVVAGQTYTFSAWLASVYPALNDSPISPANLAFSINGTNLGAFTLSDPVGVWQLFQVQWTAPANLADLAFINVNIIASGNDFALDDISLNPVPEPGMMLLVGSGLVGLAGWGRKKFRK